jgi:hypothetical protein
MERRGLGMVGYMYGLERDRLGAGWDRYGVRLDVLELGDGTLGAEVCERRVALIALGALLRLELAPVEDEGAATRL